MTDKPVFVLCDTNAAVRDAHLFRKRGGPVLVALLRALNAKLVVPEVLRTEYIAQFGKASEETRIKAVNALSALESLCGYKLVNTLPADKFWEQEAVARLEQLEKVILSVPCTETLMLAAGKRTMNGHRPTSKSDHGFKDCLIWESLMTLPAGSDVLFASRDLAAFFDGDELAPSLAKEAAAKGLSLQAFNTKQSQSLYPVVDALKERYAGVDALTLGDLPLDEHPLLASRQAEPVAPLLPRGVLDEAVDIGPPVADVAEIAAELAESRERFEAYDVKALGFVSFLGSAGKDRVVELLVNAGVPAGATRNALERLALAGHIRDTGHNYLAVQSKVSVLAAGLVEEDMVKLLGLGD